MIIIGVLLVPVIPFFILSGYIDPWADQLLEGTLFKDQPVLFGLVVVALLVVDIVLPLPSTIICTVSGGVFGGFLATIICWIGLNLSAGVGYYLSMYLGRPFAVRYTNPDRMEETADMINRMGPWALAICRALPVLAEASVLYVGLYRMKLRYFWPPILISNLLLAFAYCVLGSAAKEQKWFGTAILIATFVPFFAVVTWICVMKWKKRRVESLNDKDLNC